MSSRKYAVVVLILGCCALGTAQGGLDAVKAAMGTSRMKIERKVKLTEGTESKPPLKGETWTFLTGAISPAINYGRFLNPPPYTPGRTPSLPIYDIGVGLDNGSFGNWYRGNTLRVKVNGRDLMAEQPATRVEYKEGANGYLRLIWELENQRMLALNFLVPADGHVVCCRIDLALPGLAVEKIEVLLNCYPGGYGPLYKLPSHRFVNTAHASVEVPHDFQKSETNPFPKVQLTPDDDWIYYGDKIEDKGSLGLLFTPVEEGEVHTSKYGIRTILHYPVEVRKIYLAFTAYDQQNESAQHAMKEMMTQDRIFMTETPFWPEASEPAPADKPQQ